MNLRRNLSNLLVASCLAAASGFSVCHAQDVKFATVDMQKVYNDFKKTEEELKKLKEFEDSKKKVIDEIAAAIQGIETQMKTDQDAIQKLIDDGVKENIVKEKFESSLKPKADERMAKLKELNDARQKASQEMVSAANDMQNRLGTAITEMVQSLAKSKGVDLVLDKGVLGRTTKRSIVFTSEKVIDLTDEAIATLNK